MLILGIDPGVKGALAIFDTVERRVSVADMPDTIAGVAACITELPAVRVCVIEKPFYPKVIGTPNVAKIASAYGRVVMALHIKGVPIVEVLPADWKASLNLSSHKAASRDKATQLFPDDADLFLRAKDDGRAEAALLAWYGLRFAK